MQFQRSILVRGCIFLLIGSLAGCAGASGNAARAGDDPANVSGTGGDASFSSVIDGVNFSSSKGTDNLNAAFRLKENGHLFFMLCDPDNPVQKLNFEIPAKTGSTTISYSPPHFSYQGYVNKDMAPYDDDGVTVTISSISASRVTGVFSGPYRIEGSYPNAKPVVQVTNGKFDIPFSSSASWKKMYQAE